MAGADYISVSEFAEKFGKDRAVVNRMIHAGRIPAVKIGKQWAIPADATPPADKRVKSGKYRDWRKSSAKPSE